MPKTLFWPAAITLMGFVLLSSNLGLLPPTFWNLWPIILIVVGLGGLLTADREEWLTPTTKSTSAKKRATKKTKRSRSKKK